MKESGVYNLRYNSVHIISYARDVTRAETRLLLGTGDVNPPSFPYPFERYVDKENGYKKYTRMSPRRKYPYVGISSL